MGRKLTSRRRKTRISYDIDEEDLPSNAVDEFASGRDRVDMKHSGENSEEDMDDNVPLDDVLALEMSSDDDMSDGDRDERRKRALKEEADISAAWGSKKHMYYNSEAAQFEADEDAEEAIEEEKEALRIQKEMTEKIDQGDFGEDELDEMVEQQRLKQEAKPIADEEALSAMNKKLENIDIKLDSGDSSGDEDSNREEVEQVERDTANLSSTDKLEMIVNSCPELLGVVSSLQETIKSLRERIKAQELSTEKGISLLDVQVQLMLQYCINLLYFLLLKAEGKPVKGHPVVERLIEIRVRLEKIAPLQKKLKYMIEKLMRTATLGTIQSNDPLRFKPNPTDMATGDGGESDVESAEERRQSGLYVAPKNRSVSFEEQEKAEKQQQREMKRKLSKARRSRLMDTLREEFSETPMEIRRDDADEEEVEDRDDVERREFEEDNMLRTMLTKKEKKSKRKSKAAKQKMRHFEDIDDFEDMADFLESNAKESAKPDEEASGKQALEQLRKSKKAQRIALEAEMFDEDAMAMFEEANTNSKRKKQKKEQAKKAAEIYYNDDDGDEVDGRRDVGKKIMKNSGLKRYRNKMDKNPRVKHRRRFEKAVQKRKGVVQQYAGHNSAYDGEHTGIKTNLSRSTKL